MNPTPQFANELHRVCSRVLVNRINNPKALASRMTRGQCLRSKQRAPLTLHDCEEVQQTAALTLVRTGAINAPVIEGRPQIPFGIWKRLFRDAREVVLRNHTASGREESGILLSPDGDESALSETESLRCHALADPERLAIFRNRVADKAALALHVIRAAHRADESRKRKARKQRAIQCLRYVLSSVTGNGLCQSDTFDSDGARRRAMFDLRCYLTEGCKALGKLHGAAQIEFSSLETLPDLSGIIKARHRARIGR